MNAAACCRRSAATDSTGSVGAPPPVGSVTALPSACGALLGAPARSIDLDALLGEVPLRAGVERDRRADRLVLELDVLRFLVDSDEIGLLFEQRLDDRVRH